MLLTMTDIIMINLKQRFASLAMQISKQGPGGSEKEVSELGL